MKHPLRKILLLVIAFTLLTRLASGQPKYWEWSDPTMAHHSAVTVMVKESTGEMAARKYGVGIYIRYGKLEGILTVRHVLRRAAEIRIITQDGDLSDKNCTSWTDRDGHDVAFIPYKNKELTPLKIAETGPVIGQRYEMISLIGNNKNQTTNIRPFYLNSVASLNSTGQKSHNLDYYDSYCISGDSGSGIINNKNEVVGILSAGYDSTGKSVQNHRLYKGCVAAKHSLLVAFLNRLQTHETQYR